MTRFCLLPYFLLRFDFSVVINVYIGGIFFIAKLGIVSLSSLWFYGDFHWQRIAMEWLHMDHRSNFSLVFI